MSAGRFGFYPSPRAVVRCEHCSTPVKQEDIERSRGLFAPLCADCDRLRRERVARYLRDAADEVEAA